MRRRHQSEAALPHSLPPLPVPSPHLSPLVSSHIATSTVFHDRHCLTAVQSSAPVQRPSAFEYRIPERFLAVHVVLREAHRLEMVAHQPVDLSLQHHMYCEILSGSRWSNAEGRMALLVQVTGYSSAVTTEYSIDSSDHLSHRPHKIVLKSVLTM